MTAPILHCIKCGGRMIESKALEEIYSGTPDFTGGEVVTMSPSGRARLIDCLKCEKCGWSVTHNTGVTGAAGDAERSA
jgi:hypothetical protein